MSNPFVPLTHHTTFSFSISQIIAESSITEGESLVNKFFTPPEFPQVPQPLYPLSFLGVGLELIHSASLHRNGVREKVANNISCCVSFTTVWGSNPCSSKTPPCPKPSPSLYPHSQVCPVTPHRLTPAHNIQTATNISLPSSSFSLQA